MEKLKHYSRKEYIFQRNISRQQVKKDHLLPQITEAQCWKPSAITNMYSWNGLLLHDWKCGSMVLLKLDNEGNGHALGARLLFLSSACNLLGTRLFIPSSSMPAQSWQGSVGFITETPHTKLLWKKNPYIGLGIRWLSHPRGRKETVLRQLPYTMHSQLEGTEHLWQFSIPF